MNNEDIINWRNEAIAFLALASIKGVGYWSMRNLVSGNKSLWHFLKNSTQEDIEKKIRAKLPTEPTKWEDFRVQLWEHGVDEARRLANDGIGLIFSGQEEFPDSLATIPDRPLWLFVQGELSNLHSKCVAIVGTRKPTEDGIFLTKYLMAALADKPYPTVSGLALGIDQIVHLESLRYGIPTVAVLGTGIRENYPRGSEKLRNLIVENGGTIVSEYLINQSYSAENFVRRNRIQAGLCDALFPVEWKIKSGTAHTVEFAYKYKRKIINVFLPNTYDLRPELKFSIENYGSVACEAPKMTTLMIEYLEENDRISYVQNDLFES